MPTSKYYLTIIIVACLALCFPNFAIAGDNGPTVKTIAQLTGIKKDDIYYGAMMWIINNFQSIYPVIEYDDFIDGKLVGGGIIGYPCEGDNCLSKKNWKVHFKMEIAVVDEKINATFRDISLITQPAGSAIHLKEQARRVDDLELIEPKLTEIVDQIVEGIHNGISIEDLW